ncbi:Major facilitator, sugar transporter-like [Dillenia turbinata]|uniref:Major facilitator, sugar transporter-like n=1 Tax=Dillenia turbinata TaxID=194707 RepID=A0AAN8W558_9MAGN
MVSGSLSILSSATTSSFPPNSTTKNTSLSTPRIFNFNSSKQNPTFLKPTKFLRIRASSPSSSSTKLAGEDGSAEQFLQNNSIADFMRFKRGIDDRRGSGELQTAVVSYRKCFPWFLLQPFLQVDLVSTIHIADKEYFATLQKELEHYDCVLYEMVASRESLENRRNAGATKRLKGSRSRGFNILGCIQRQMARVLTLDFQLDCLDYQAENWYHADLDFETFKILQLEKGESFFTFARDMTLKSTKAMVLPGPIREDLGPWRSKLLWASRVLPMPLVGLVIIGSVCADVGSQASEYPELEALSRLDFGAAMKVFLAKRLTSEFTQVTADVEKRSVIIGERNRAAIEALQRAIEEGHNKIAILYGGGHMPDLGRRLREEFDMIPSRVQWITAWSIQKRDVKSSSLPFLKRMAEISGWPLNRYQTLALLLFSSILALDLWFWEIFFGTAANWISNAASETLQYIADRDMTEIPHPSSSGRLPPNRLHAPIQISKSVRRETNKGAVQLFLFARVKLFWVKNKNMLQEKLKVPFLSSKRGRSNNGSEKHVGFSSSHEGTTSSNSDRKTHMDVTEVGSQEPKNGEEDRTVHKKRASLNKYALAYIGVMSGAVLYIKDNLKITSIEEEILVGSLNVCSLIGSLASGKTSDMIGRRYTIVLSAATFFIGALLMGLAPSYAFLMMGRVIAGIGVGYSLMIAPVYTAELSPAMTRGFLSALPEVFINIGILLGYVSNYVLSGLPEHINWRLMLGIAAVPATAIGFGVLAMPESPRWLVMRGRIDEAKRILMRTSENAQEAETRLEEMARAALVEVSDIGKWRGQGAWKELLIRPTRPIRRILFAALGINFFMQASGNDAVVYYCPAVFRAAGIHNKQQLVGVTVIMGIAKTSFVLISALYLDKFGRRPLLLLGTAGMAFSLAGLGLGSKFLEHSGSKPTWVITLCILAVCADVSFFSIGLGPITWVYSSEIFPSRLRAQGSSLAVSLNRLVSGVVAMSFLSISEKITFGGMFFVLSGIMALGTVFFFFFLPETKGKSLEEIGTLFEDKKRDGSNG